jgi:hypothetical protein
MALNPQTLASALISATGVQATDTAGREAMARMAQAIHDYLLQATVTVDVSGTAATSTGPAPVTGTGTGGLT